MASHLSNIDVEGIRDVLTSGMSDSTTLFLLIGSVVIFFLFRKKGALDLRNAVLITFIFTVLDYIAHVMGILPVIAELPTLYFIFKLIALPLTLIILVNRFNLRGFSLCIAAAILLQIRYFLLNIYSTQVNILMIVIHYFLILISIMIVRRMFKGKL